MTNYPAAPVGNQGKRRPSLARFAADTRGIAATEFGMVAVPFMMFCISIFGLGADYFTRNTLSHTVEVSSRVIRTGLAQIGNSGASVQPLTTGQFTTLICNNADNVLNCDSSHLIVHIQNWTNWAQVAPVACTDGSGNLTPATGTGTDLINLYTGGASQVVLVTVCYKWDTAKMIPWIPLGKLAGGAGLVQAASAFRTEPYN